MSKRKKKPAPISTRLTKGAPPKPRKDTAPTPVEAPQAFNDVSPITAQQIKRAEKAIDNLRVEVGELRKTPPKIQVSSPETKVVLPERPRITKVTIKYDQLGYPSELIPQYSKAAG